MRRWWVTLALLLSLGINVGLVAAVAAGRWAEGREAALRREAAEEPPPVVLPGGGREIPGATSVEVPEEEVGATGRGEGPDRRARAAARRGAQGVSAADDEPAAGVDDPAVGRRGRAPRDRAAAGEAGPRGHGDHPGEPPLGRLADHLGLAGEPRERFVALQRELVRGHLEARRERVRLGAELRRELVEPEPDPARVEDLIARLGESYLASERATAEAILRSRELLDDEQQEAYLRFLDRLRHDGRNAAWHEGGDRGGRRRHGGPSR